MKRKHLKIFGAVMRHPTPANIKWRDVVSLIEALGGEVDETREGSRVAFMIGPDVIGVFHKPHPGNEMKRYAVQQLAKAFDEFGIAPEPAGKDKRQDTDKDKD